MAIHMITEREETLLNFFTPMYTLSDVNILLSFAKLRQIDFFAHGKRLQRKIVNASYRRLSKELKNSIKIQLGQAVPELLI